MGLGQRPRAQGELPPPRRARGLAQAQSDPHHRRELQSAGRCDSARRVYAAFGLGEGEKHISTIDADGIALLSIQTLYQMSLEQEKKIEALTKEIQTLRAADAKKSQGIAELKAADEEVGIESRRARKRHGALGRSCFPCVPCCSVASVIQ
ncbi:MAG: hypothetical protein N3E42_01365 [Candidatus Bipolaricaulota bacterium]|nr:hypothetical protein [Candidatus Bipolaricaulota bacterium]